MRNNKYAIILTTFSEIHPIVVDRTSKEYFVNAVNPQIVIASHSVFPPEEQVPSKWKEDIAQRDVRVFDQLETGAVRIDLEDSTLTATPFLGDGVHTLRNRAR